MVVFLNLMGQTILAYISVFAFGIMLNIPRRTLNRAGIVGACAWLVYELVIVLTQHFLDKNVDAGYLEVNQPHVVNEASGYGTGQ